MRPVIHIIYMLLVLFLLSRFDAQSQQPGKIIISGQVKDIQNEPVPGASIRLLLAKDSIPVQSLVASSKGRFEFRGMSPGAYLVAVSATGMQTYMSPLLKIDMPDQKLEMNTIILQPLQKKELDAVVVTAKKPLLEHDLDKTIVNVESMIGASTGNTLDLLERTPGITVDANGEISLYGSSGITVLIDGRRTYMSGRDLAAYLRSMPGSMIDKLELITNPPARYEAQGGALINIRLKKKRTAGYAGSIYHSSNIGRFYKSYNSINLNYLRKKLNLFSNISYNRHTDFTESTDQRLFFGNDGNPYRSSQLQNGTNILSNDLSGRLGLDYQLNSKATLGLILNASTRKRDDSSWYQSNSFSKTPAPDSIGLGGNATDGKWKQFSANINFQYKFNEKGRELTADANHIKYDHLTTQWLQNSVQDPAGAISSRNNFFYHLPYNTDVYTAAADYTHPMPQRMNITTGVKSSFVKTDHQSDHYELPENKPVADYSRSNHFIYRETIHAAYVSGRKDWKRFGLQLGVRWENTLTRGHQLGNVVVPESIVSRNYHSFFPSLFTSYKLDSAGKHILLLNLTRRINRPGYQQLNPFLLFQDQYTYSGGNPDLKPSFFNRIELIWRHKQLLNTRLMVDRMTGGISGATRIEDGVQITRTENYGSRLGIALMVSLNTKAASWWTISFNPAVARFETRTRIQEQPIQLLSYTWRVQFNNQFRFGNDWSAELSGGYNAPIIEWQKFVKSRYWLNTTVQKKIWKGKGSIKLNIDDIFRGMGYREETRGLINAYTYRNSIQDTRRLGLSINYNFGKETFTRKRKYNDNAADELKERAQ